MSTTATLGRWDVRILDDNWGIHPNRHIVVATFTPVGSAKPSRVIRRDNLTWEEVETFSAQMSWSQALHAETKAAKLIKGE